MELLLVAAVFVTFIIAAYMVMGLSAESDGYHVSVSNGHLSGNDTKALTKKLFSVANKLKK